MKQSADIAMVEAEQYARKVMIESQLSFSNLNHENKELVNDAVEQIRLKLIVQFIFPQLDEWQKGLLVCLYWERELVEKLCNNIPSQSMSYSIMFERYMTQIEQRFMDLVEKIKRFIPFNHLSPIQQAVIEEKFIKITFKEH